MMLFESILATSATLTRKYYSSEIWVLEMLIPKLIKILFYNQKGFDKLVLIKCRMRRM